MRNYTRIPDRACGAPGARKRARRVREAVRGNGPADKARTAPRIDFTTHISTVVRNRLKRIQYRPALIGGFLA